MTEPFPTSVRAALIARSFALQGSFNYRSLNGSGFAWVLLPALRGTLPQVADLDDAVRRHQEPFNSHPYLVGIAVGAVARLEQERTPPATIERFKGALRGSLGSLGDVFFWAGVRPACMLGALILVALGAPTWAVLTAFLAPYNVAHIAVRVWSFALGFRYGAGVASGLRNAPFARVGIRAKQAGAVLLGALVPIIALGGLTGETGPIVAVIVALGVGLGMARGGAIRGPALAGLALLIAFGLIRGAFG